MKILILTLAASCISAILYRLGGSPAGTRWRDIGCGLVFMATCLAIGLHTSLWATLLAYFLTFGLMWGALASYFGLDERKYGYWAHGLAISLAAAPVAYITGHWIGFGIRCVILTAAITVWSQITSWDTLEEGGRGFFIGATIPLLLF